MSLLKMLPVYLIGLFLVSGASSPEYRFFANCFLTIVYIVVSVMMEYHAYLKKHPIKPDVSDMFQPREDSYMNDRRR